MDTSGRVGSVEELREIYRPPAELALRKQIDALDRHCREFIAHSPFLVMASADGAGRCDASPKGGPPGFVRVLDDHRLVIPDLSGNNRLDSITNLVVNPGIALLFFVPGRDETLRVNGRAAVTADADLCERARLDGVVPRLVLLVDVEEAYLHCAKAFRRAQLWQPEEWPDTAGLPSGACMMRDHIGLTQVPLEQTEALLEESYRSTLWQTGGA